MKNTRTILPAQSNRVLPWLAFVLIVGLWAAVQLSSPTPAHATVRAIAGRVIDEHGEPVGDVQIELYVNDDAEPAARDLSQSDGSYVLVMPARQDIQSVHIEYRRAHFEPLMWQASAVELNDILEHGGVVLEDIALKRRFTAGFWVATLTFAGMLALIAFERLHNTLAALLGIAVIFGVSVVGSAITPSLFVIGFEQALSHVDFNVIFLLLGMMIVIGVVEETGVFQWLAYQAFRIARGKVWLLVVILMLVTTLLSALLDNVITMLLIAPITIEIALVMGINPLALLLPEILSSNVGGVSTLVGTPTNIMIGTYADLGFNDFLANLTPGVLVAEAALIGFMLLWYRKEYRKPVAKPSKALLQRLEENARIKDPDMLKKAGIVFGVLIGLFIFGESIHLTPTVSAIIGAVAMLIWVHPHIDDMMSAVDWTTLIFFIGLFMVVGAVQEVGLISLIAKAIADLVGGSPIATLLVVIWVSALFSGLVENIPFAAAMLPVAAYLTRTVAGLDDSVLFYGLAIGAGLGGNSSLIGSSPNLVTAGIAKRVDYPITFKRFLKVGLPATAITVAVACIWLIIRFF